MTSAENTSDVAARKWEGTVLSASKIGKKRHHLRDKPQKESDVPLLQFA